MYSLLEILGLVAVSAISVCDSPIIMHSGPQFYVVLASADLERLW